MLELRLGSLPFQDLEAVFHGHFDVQEQQGWERGMAAQAATGCSGERVGNSPSTSPNLIMREAG